MAHSLTSFQPPVIRACASSRSEPNSRKAGSSNWWTPLFGWSSDPDYIGGGSAMSDQTEAAEKERPRSRFQLGCFTEEKAKQLRKKTLETSSFHDVMYHSAIASRLATDLSSPRSPQP